MADTKKTTSSAAKETKETPAKVETVKKEVVKEAAKAVEKTVKEVKAVEDKVEAVASEVATEVKAAVKTTAQKATAKKTAAKKTVAAAKPAVKKAVEKKVAEKKTEAAEKKATATRTVNKSKLAKVYLQIGEAETSQEDLLRRIIDKWVAETGKKESAIKSFDVYVKPEDQMAYYVINGEASMIELF